MAFADIEAKTTIVGFTDAQKTAILADLKTAYEGSAIAKQMFDSWIATAGHLINIKYVAGVYQAYTIGNSGTGNVEIDPAYITDLSYINDKGTPILHSQLGAVVHELGHALTGRHDNLTDTDYQGDNVKYINTIWAQLGLDLEISYIAQARNNLHTVGYTYTNGAAINAARTGDIDINTSALLVSNDLLIGGPSNNILQSGFGSDFLFGAGGNDQLLGGIGIDTAVYKGAPLDYDIRKNDDGTWTVRHARGAKDAGTDTLTNIETVQFDAAGGGHQSFQLQKKGLTFQTDFAIVVDTTGSMGSSISSVKAAATGLVEAAFAGGKADARIGVVTFKDVTNGEPSEVVLPFTDQDDFATRKAAAIAAINGIGLGSGGDIPETAFDGLRLALDGSMGKWRAGAGILRVALFTDAEAKDGALADVVSSLAQNIGATVGGISSLVGPGGSVDTFNLVFDNGAPGSGEGLFGDGDPLSPFVRSDEPVTPDANTSQVQIFTIATGTPSWDTTAFENISAANGGKFLTATDNDALVEALFNIIEEVDNLPTDIALSGAVIAENAVIGQVVGSLSASDADPDDTFTYSLVANPGDLFAIEGNTLVVAAALDYETATAHSLTIRVKDSTNNTFDKNFTIAVTDVVDGGGVTIIGTEGADRIDATHTVAGQPLPTGKADLISGRGGDDIISGGLGNDTLDGGNGYDTLVLSGLPSQYQFSGNTLTGVEGVDRVTNFEQYRFGSTLGNDLYVSDLWAGDLSDPVGPNVSPAKELLLNILDIYQAYFNRAPEVTGLMYWFGKVVYGELTLAETAQSFTDQPEYAATYPAGTSNSDFIKEIYQNLFNRAPETAGLEYWENDLNHGVARDIFIYSVIQGAYAPTGGVLDRALLSNKHDASLYYAEQLALHPTEAFDAKIDQVLSRITADAQTIVQAEEVIDYVIENPITLSGLITGSPATWEAFWS